MKRSNKLLPGIENHDSLKIFNSLKSLHISCQININVRSYQRFERKLQQDVVRKQMLINKKDKYEADSLVDV